MKTNNFIKKSGLLIAVLVMFTLFFAGKKQFTNKEYLDDIGVEVSAENDISSLLNINLKKDTNVLVTVNTKEIDKSNIESTVVLSDDRSEPSENSGKPSSFVSVVEKNQKIYWRGAAKDPNSGDVVEILKIYRKTDGGSEILDKTFKDPNKRGVVVGKIKNKKIAGLEYYNIRIIINQDSTRIYDIDPKLRMLAIN